MEPQSCNNSSWEIPYGEGEEKRLRPVLTCLLEEVLSALDLGADKERGEKSGESVMIMAYMLL